MFIESIVTKEFYEGLESGFLSECDFDVEWVAKNSDELKERGVDLNFQEEDLLLDEEEFYYIRVWLNCSLDEIGMEPFLRHLG